MRWKSQREAYKESIDYMKGRRDGVITSLPTPWPTLNAATIDGFEWQSMVVIGGRPGSGKTTIKDQIIRHAAKAYKQKFRVLEFSLEMLGRVSAIRSYSAQLDLDYKALCSVGSKLTDAQLKKCVEYAREITSFPIDIVEKAPTIAEFKSIIQEYMKVYSITNPDGSISYTDTIVTVDHSLLMRRKGGQNVNDMLYELGEAITQLKKMFPITFIILSQLNRSSDHPDRNEDGKYGNHILESDIFGADALLQHADVVLGLNRPGKQKIKFYGPERYIIPDDKLLVMHLLKMRNGETGMLFFQTQYERMQINETSPPAKAKGRMSSFN